ncbi:uncharacterized protein LOC123989115 [Osmia bicornis bicornis]|uniref:uncharacterized protein LOC123989096 n=1 Tax=Osmia bicornis bicornis TaxID=1437191 RepID=UPI001EAF0385|nr:uncharacterized protein LOC123989096 [Osmia bicornis bicornis]XP_046145756.1 uncharacterized protein LOC123989115 [Osmia bicornis bicornis]
MRPSGEHKIAASTKRDRTSADTNRVSDGTRFSQINLQHCKAATDILHHRLVTRQTDIALIQEPWISKERVGGLDTRCGSLYYDATSTRPRACIFVKKEITALKLNEYCTADLSAVKVKLNLGGNTSELVICSAYLPYDSEDPPPTRELRALIGHCANNGLHLVIGCDANSHHTVWGSTNTNGRGTALLEYLATTGLEILNKGSAPTHVTSRRQEVIDLTLGSAKVAQVAKHWQVRDESTLSDHRLITFNLKGDREGGTGEAYRNPKATNWALYREGLEGRLKGHCQRPRTVGEIEQAVKHLSSAVTQAYEVACPAKIVSSSKRVPW